MEIKKISIGEGYTYQIFEDGYAYYPCSTTMTNVLLKSKLSFYNYEKYKLFTKQFDIDYGYDTGGIQTVWCMSDQGWINYTKTAKFGKMSDLQRSQHNKFCDLILSQYKYIKDRNDHMYDEYMIDCINEYEVDNPNCKHLKCSLCEREYPMSKEFFVVDDRIQSGYSTTCKMCKGNYYPIVCKDSQARYIYKEYGLEIYELYKNNIITFYNKYCHNNDFKLTIKDKETCLRLIKHYYDNGLISKNDLNIKYVKEYLNVEIYTNIGINNNSIIEYCSDYDCKTRPWLYDNYILGCVDYKQANTILNQYIIDNNIKIKNIFSYSGYSKLLHNSKLSQFENNILKFVVQYYDYKYAAYKFKLRGVNYYKDKEMRMFDMRWFVEKDLNIPIHKIPLYVTKYALQQKALPLYNIINKYYSSLFEWVDECYPNEFNINDFEINPYRAEFDSLEESQIDDILRQNINNVIYNGRNNTNTINIKGMIPDWLIFTDNACYLVEYFGMHTDKESSLNSSHRLRRYKEKEENKLDKYKHIKGYSKIFIYPNDLKHNFEGLINKIHNII